MRRMPLWPLAIAVLFSLLTGLSRPAPGQAPAQTVRTDSSSGITVKAVYLTTAALKENPRDPLYGKVDPDRTIVFAVTLDTHSGDLSAWDILKNTVLRNDRGQQVAPQRWVAIADGTHHRAGGLVFPRTDQAGRAIDAEAKTLELVVRGLGAGPERVLRWSLPLP